VLLKALTSSHPQLRELGSRGDDVRRVLRSAGTVLDALGTVRNNASLAHPNDARIGHPEALLVINITRSLLLFLETKLSAPPI
jgi:hypothetical protein